MMGCADTNDEVGKEREGERGKGASERGREGERETERERGREGGRERRREMAMDRQHPSRDPPAQLLLGDVLSSLPASLRTVQQRWCV